MFRLIWGIYTGGIIVCFVLFLLLVPNIPLISAVFSAVLWPYGVYEHFIATGIPAE